MKTINIFPLFIISFLTLGCSSDDTSEPSFENLITGEWKLTDIRVSGTLTVENILGTEETILFLDAINYNNYQANISRAPNEIAPSGSFGITVSASFWDLGETFYKNINDILVFNAGSWSIDSNTLLVSSGNETQSYVIININDVSMTISTTINSEMDIYEQKSPVAIYLLISFNKI